MTGSQNNKSRNKTNKKETMKTRIRVACEGRLQRNYRWQLTSQKGEKKEKRKEKTLTPERKRRDVRRLQEGQKPDKKEKERKEKIVGTESGEAEMEGGQTKPRQAKNTI